MDLFAAMVVLKWLLVFLTVSGGDLLRVFADLTGM